MRTLLFTLVIAACGGPSTPAGPSNTTPSPGSGAVAEGSANDRSSSGDPSGAGATSGTGGTGGGGPYATGGSGAPAPSNAKLAVTSLAPDKGDFEGGTYVVIKGARFIKDGPRNLKVYFGTRQGTVVRFQSDSEVIVQAPGGPKDTAVDVLLIFDPGGQLKLPSGFTFVDKGGAAPSVDDLDTKKK